MSERELRMWRDSAEAYEKRTLDVERLENVSRKIRDQAHSELAQVAQLGHVAIPVDDAYWLLQRLRDLQRQLEQAEQLLREHVENFDERLTLEQYPDSLAARTFVALGRETA